MRRVFLCWLAIVGCVITLPSAAFAWDVTYDGSMLPNSAALGQAVWKNIFRNDLSGCSVQDGVLHLVDQSADKTAVFSRELMLSAGTPITLEARVKISSATPANDSPARIEVATANARVVIGLWTNKITCGQSESSVDMTGFHVIRVGLQVDRQYHVWLDGTQVISGTSTAGSQTGIAFGSSWQPGGTVDSYWDYVSYSKAYLPVE